MLESFEAIFRKTISHGYGHLHQWASTGKIKGFTLAYLGQQDSKLPYKIAELVPRESVVKYPTDFSAMSDEDIEMLANRGEQLTRTLLSHHRPDLC
jgi:NTE family protein